jgi:carbon storage regulator CsrA
MLVLSRKKGESLLIGDIVVTVKTLSKGKVQLAVEADKSVKILRSELKDKHEAA